MKDKKSLFINILFVLSVISLVLFASELFINKLFPTNYRLISIALLILIHIIIGFVLINYNKKIVYIISTIVLVLLLLAQTVAAIYVYRTYTGYNSRVSENTKKKVVFYIITLKTNKQVNTIEDMKTASVYYDKHETKEDLANIKEDINKVNNKIKYVEGSGALELAKNLLKGKIKYMLLNESKLPIIEEGISEFRKAYKIVKLYSNSEKDKIEIEKNELTNAINTKSDQSFNILISGGDAYEDLQSDLRSDVNIILTINPKTHNILITHIPRDSYVMMRDLGYDKLTHSSTYGIRTLIGTIEDLLETDINYYVKINFASLENIVDALGGVNVYNDYEFTSRTKGFYFPYGKLELNGEESLEFVRERYSLPSGEFDRGKNQMKVLTAILNKAISPSVVFNYTSVLDTVLDSMITNFPSSKITEIVNDQIKTMASWTIESHQIEGEPVNGLYSYTMPDYDLAFIELDEDEIIQATQRIKKVLGNNVEESKEKERRYVDDNTENEDWD